MVVGYQNYGCERKRKSKNRKENKVILMIDFENIINSMPSSSPFEKNYASIATAIENLIRQLEKIGKVVQAYIFAPPHSLSIYSIYAERFYYKGIIMISCPKIKKMDYGISHNPFEDTVDEILRRCCDNWIIQGKGGITHFCLASGDSDFLRMIKELKRNGIKIIIAAGNNASLSGVLEREADTIESREGKVKGILLFPFNKFKKI